MAASWPTRSATFAAADVLYNASSNYVLKMLLAYIVEVLHLWVPPDSQDLPQGRLCTNSGVCACVRVCVCICHFSCSIVRVVACSAIADEKEADAKPGSGKRARRSAEGSVDEGNHYTIHRSVSVERWCVCEVCIFTHIHAHTHTYARMHTHARMHTRAHTLMHAHTHARTHTHTRRVRRCPSRGVSGGPPPGKISKNEAKSCILSEKRGAPGTQDPIRGTRLHTHTHTPVPR